MGSEQQNALERRDALLFWEGVYAAEGKEKKQGLMRSRDGIGLDAILAPECETHGLIDETLRTYLEFVGMYRGTSEWKLHHLFEWSKHWWQMLDNY